MKLWSLLVGTIAVVTANPLSSRQTACVGNTAVDRAAWCQYSTSTNYYNVTPDTGVTREYYFNIEQVTIAPDGFERIAYTVNGTIPGPTIIADWGDTVVVHVTNSLTTSGNGTSIHFHGIRQLMTNQMDGVPSITQCPTPPRSSMTYTWRATEYGSSWYHSHIGLQAWEGVVGGIVINGPATANYDVDKGTLFLLDWSHATADELYDSVLATGPAELDNGLINGTNVYQAAGSTTQTGSRFTTAFVPAVSYLFRLVNGAIDTHFKFSIDNHTMTVIASDFVPIQPYETTVLDIAMGKSISFSSRFLFMSDDAC
jgi:FtsP/CotA-like multicopper oxidase with cupredoxin domain